MDLLSTFAERALDRRLRRLRHGRLVVRNGERLRSYGDPAARTIEIHITDPRCYRAIALGGAVGAGESYAEGWWTSSDLTGVVRLLVRNRDVLEGLERGTARFVQPVRALWHRLRRNTRRGSRRNIGAHYDLGNEFFSSFLDETLTYSSGVFERPDATLAQASVAKYDRLAEMLQLGPKDRVIEIGTGWGGFAIHAADKYGCHVTTTTISREQYALATRRVREAGLSDRITILQQDYRDLTGRFDKLVSIEMIEAVGHEHYATFFAKCAALLEPHGRAAIQAITIQDQYYESARREVDFIKRHIFPGSCIPSRTILGAASGRAGLRVDRVDEMGLHYAETLRRWRVNFRAARPRLLALGLDDRFQRLWEFYFCYCEGGFLERAIGTIQLSLAKPGAVDTHVRRLADVPELEPVAA